MPRKLQPLKVEQAAVEDLRDAAAREAEMTAAARVDAAAFSIPPLDDLSPSASAERLPPPPAPKTPPPAAPRGTTRAPPPRPLQVSPAPLSGGACTGSGGGGVGGGGSSAAVSGGGESSGGFGVGRPQRAVMESAVPRPPDSVTNSPATPGLATPLLSPYDGLGAMEALRLPELHEEAVLGDGTVVAGALASAASTPAGLDRPAAAPAPAAAPLKGSASTRLAVPGAPGGAAPAPSPSSSSSARQTPSPAANEVTVPTGAAGADAPSATHAREQSDTTAAGGMVSAAIALRERAAGARRPHRNLSQQAREEADALLPGGTYGLGATRGGPPAVEPVLRFRFRGKNPMLALGADSADTAPDDSSAMRSLYGSVRLAVDTTTDRVVAIKCSNVERLRRKLRRGPSYDNPVAEASLLRSIPPHPHLVALVAEWVQGGTHYLAMERAPGCDLMAYAEAGVRLSTRASRSVFRQMLSAVRHLHRSGVAHLDISCENVMAWREPNRGRWHATVIDLGAARPAGREDVLPGAQPGRRVHLPGKPGYHAPEMYTDPEWRAHPVDAYACGVVLFALLLDAQPYASPRPDDRHFCQLQELGMAAYLREWGMESSITDDALDLLTGLMDPCPSSRLTVGQALRHPWLASRR